ncbi:MAG: sigma-70 family RNA polymerase sigma factor [Bdellovibrionales bacterium]
MSRQFEDNFSSTDFLEKLINKDHKTVELVVKAYTEQLYRGALGLGFDQVHAGEVVQSVWVTFFDVVSSFQGRSHIRTFIFGILYNKASELRRENKKFDSKDPVEEVLDDRFDLRGAWKKPPIDPEQFLMASETMELIDKCLEKLPVNQRMAFCLKEIDDHGSSDICNILSVTTTNLGVLLYRAKNSLRECIEAKAKMRRI